MSSSWRRWPSPFSPGRRPAPAQDFAPLRFAFDIAMGVRKGDEASREALDALIARHGPELRAIIEEYGVPILPVSEQQAGAAGRQE